MADRQWKPKIQCPVELKDYFESIKIFLECKKKKKDKSESSCYALHSHRENW